MTSDLDAIAIAEGEFIPGESVALVERHSTQLIRAESAADFVTRAAELAAALAAVIEKQKMYRQLGPKHVTVEGWTTLGSMLGAIGIGVYAVPDGPPEEVEIDGVSGVRATMKAVTADGQVIGGGTGYCMRSEANWRSKDFYAVAGMAQTRATSRALRQPLGWIVALAGFEATPGEEMEGGTPAKADEPRPEPLNQDPKLLANFLGLQKTLLDQGDNRWSMENVLASAERAFGRPVEKLKDLTNKELKQMITGAETAIEDSKVPFGEEEENSE